MKIFLVGYMGSGKSKTGEDLARMLGYSFIDTDSLIEKRKKQSISSMFREKGEEYFRECEAEILRELESKDKLVVSAGGGLPCFHNNMDWMNTHGITVYLEANPGLLFHRLVMEREGRPLIADIPDIELMDKISRHIAQRGPVYKKAKITINAVNLQVKSLLLLLKKMGVS